MKGTMPLQKQGAAKGGGQEERLCRCPSVKVRAHPRSVTLFCATAAAASRQVLATASVILLYREPSRYESTRFAIKRWQALWTLCPSESCAASFALRASSMARLAQRCAGSRSGACACRSAERTDIGTLVEGVANTERFWKVVRRRGVRRSRFPVGKRFNLRDPFYYNPFLDARPRPIRKVRIPNSGGST